MLASGLAWDGLSPQSLPLCGQQSPFLLCALLLPFGRSSPVSYFALHHLSFTPRDHSIVYPSAAVASSSAGPAAVGNSASETQNREESMDMGGDFNSPLSVTGRCRIRRL